MTEESFQQGRKVMQKANYWRGVITNAKGNVAKWTKIESSYRTNLQPSRADGAKQLLDKAMKRLQEVRDVFESIKFPENNVKSIKKENVQCDLCGNKVENTDSIYCNYCMGIV